MKRLRIALSSMLMTFTVLALAYRTASAQTGIAVCHFLVPIGNGDCIVTYGHCTSPFDQSPPGAPTGCRLEEWWDQSGGCWCREYCWNTVNGRTVTTLDVI